MTRYVDASGANVQRCDRCGNRMPLWGCDRNGDSICDDCERAARAATPCPCGSGLPRYEGACPACYPSVQRATADSALCLVRMVGTDEPLPRCEAYPKCVCGGPEGWPDEPRASAARHARVISGTGDSGERRELAALVRGLRERREN